MHIGHKEQRSNRSPLIDGWVRACGLDPSAGLPWCAAFASWCIGLEPGIAGALRLGKKFKRTDDPLPGDLMFFATDDKGAGHVGIVVARVGGYVLCIEGNSANRVRYCLRVPSEVKFASVSDEYVALPEFAQDEWSETPVVAVTKAGTR